MRWEIRYTALKHFLIYATEIPTSVSRNQKLIASQNSIVTLFLCHPNSGIRLNSTVSTTSKRCGRAPPSPQLRRSLGYRWNYILYLFWAMSIDRLVQCIESLSNVTVATLDKLDIFLRGWQSTDKIWECMIARNNCSSWCRVASEASRLGGVYGLSPTQWHSEKAWQKNLCLFPLQTMR